MRRSRVAKPNTRNENQLVKDQTQSYRQNASTQLPCLTPGTYSSGKRQIY